MAGVALLGNSNNTFFFEMMPSCAVSVAHQPGCSLLAQRGNACFLQ